MEIKLSADGYEKIDARIQAIEDLAYGGVFAKDNARSKLQNIIAETKKLRQTLREVLYLVPAVKSNRDGGDAA
jgi:hypothetical protein